MAKAKKLPSGNWRVQVYLGAENGKKIVESVTAPTKKEAEFRAAELKMTRGRRVPLTLSEASKRFIALNTEVFSPATIRSYTTIHRTTFAGLMNRPLSDITQADIQAAVNREAATHEPKTVRNINGYYALVFKMFRPSFRYEVALPKRKKAEVYIPDRDTLDRIAKKIKGQKIELPFLLASRLGLRASEIAGLTFSAIDRNAGTVTISQAQVNSLHGPVMKTPKTAAGHRRLYCPKDLLDRIGNGDPDASVTGLTQQAITKRWRRFMATTDETYFSFHKLRHYFASRALLTGVPQRYIMEIMGHSTPDMLNRIYQHTFEKEKEEFQKKIMENL